MEFFIAMVPPTATHQEKKIRIIGNKPVVYDSEQTRNARAKLQANLFQHRPEKPIEGRPVELVTKWCFPARNRKENGVYRITKPDTDNLQKLLKDCMTAVGFWKDDALVCREIVEKFWADTPGIYIRVTEL